MARKNKKNNLNYPKKKKKSARDVAIQILAFVMVFTMVIVIIIPVYGPLKELFSAIGKQLAPFTQPVFDWFNTTFQSIISWVQGLF